MKKIVFVLIMCFIVTGCSKGLKCTSSTENDVVKIRHSYKIDYSGDNITKVTDTVIYNVINESLIENFRALSNFSKNNLDTYGVKSDYKENGKIISLTSYYEVDKLNDELVVDLIGTKNLNEYRTKLEKAGYKCK